MPTYVYACKECKHQFEIFQSFSDKAVRTCPDCGEKALSKVIFPAGVVFKGSGFYVNDSKVSARSSSSTTESASESESKSKTASSNGADSKSKSEKPDAAKESTPSGSKTDS